MPDRIATLIISLLCLSAPLGIQAQDPTSADPGEKDAEEADWDVQSPPGPTATAHIDVTEGTWMNLDVSPDGETIVFDLLGDIFTVPIAGGEARQLTSGMAWDQHPQFSHDGSRIAFISDRSGGDNLWIMDADGSEPRQVTEESFRLVHNPAWMPGDDYIAVRKHFTGTRSLGAGEIWLYHVSGGDGLRMVEKRNDQKDINEPRFSPDGRYLYYTLDVTEGDIWAYNKDSAGEIYRIRRLDLETGETDQYITGAGGAVHPLPSPDGRYVAFVRRKEFATNLYLKDVESGREWSIYDGLERDNQEIWAIHGLYPNMEWTPDSSSIVFWADGGIHRIDVETGELSDIPFHVEKEMELRETVRFEVPVAPPEFPVRMLRWVSVSPDGDRVVYAALGKLWVKDLPDGEPSRLTRQSDHLEGYPSWSADGRRIVYATWDDQDLGSIRTVSARGGRSRTLTDEPGHYVEPRLSPSGDRVVFRKTSAGFLHSPWWSEETGVFVMDLDQGDPIEITDDGTQPSFSPDGRGILVTRGGGDSRNLTRIDLETREERELVTTTYGTDFAVSPDGGWVAFQERFNAYVAALPKTGGPISIGPDTTSHPVAKVSRDAGNYLHWAGDGRTLHWSLGDELYSQSLKASFAFFEGAPEELPDPPASGRRIGFTAKHDVPGSVIALTGAQVVTMDGDRVIEAGTVLVEGNRIVAVGPDGEVAVPPDARVFDLDGKTLIPGIVDAHWHGAQGENGFVPQDNWENLATLAWGVTTIHDPSNDNETIFEAKEMARAGLVTAPRIFTTGRILYGATTSFTAEVDSLEDARSHLRRMKAIGAESVKSYNQPRRDQRQQILEAARELELNVVPEGGALFQHNMNQIVDGHTTIEHSLPNENVFDDVIQLWSQSGTAYTPTLVVGYGGIMGENYWYQHMDVFDHPKIDRFVPRRLVDPRSRRRTKAPEYEYNHFDLAEDAARLQDRGVEVAVGAHGQREGLGSHWEMWMFAQGGMEPLEVIRAATLDGARALGFDQEIGSLEAGKLADLVVMDADPLADIRNTDSVSMVMLNGRLYDANTMAQIAPERTEAPEFWFAEEN